MRILFLSAIVPYPPTDGDRQRSYHLLKALSEKHDVHLCCFYRTEAEREQLQALKSPCISVTGVPITNWEIRWNCLQAWPTKQPLNVAAFASEAMQSAVARIIQAYPIDAVHAYRLRMAPYALEVPEKIRVLDYTDALTRYFAARKDQPARFWEKLYLQREARCIQKYEVNASYRFDASIISSPLDREVLRTQGASESMEVVTNGVDTSAVRPAPKLPKTQTVLFVGNMQYPPNAQGVAGFCTQTWPRVIAAVPGAKFLVIGNPPQGQAKQWALKYPGAIFQGMVPELQPFYAQARVVVCPLDVASGRQFKVIEAFAAGVPVATTSVVAKNLDAAPGKHLLTGDTPETLADQIIHLLRDDKLAERIRQNARKLAVQTYDWSQVAQALLDLYARWEPKRKSGAKPKPKKPAKRKK
jgi:sugar transferase (PEP-CTERM/EpsH1 system associated)